MADLYMDNEPVEVGDKVYDLRFGAGSVSEVIGSDNKIKVTFQEPKTTLNFLSDGTRGGKTRRSLYWQNPVFDAPPKNETVWTEAAPVLRGIIKTFRLLSQKVS